MAAAAPYPATPLRPGWALFHAALSVAVLDGIYAVVVSSVRGVSASRVFQGVAAGLLGPAAFEGGTPAALLGTALHFVNATLIVAIYHLASRRLGFLVRRPVAWGVLYGVAVYFVMTFVVVPLSAATFRMPSASMLVLNIVSHALLVGLPTALFARAAGGAVASPAAPLAAA